jgi:hypothetical protein
MTHFRPIALANFLFKIIPKILAVRLSHVVQRIISPHQAAFIPGPLNVMIVRRRSLKKVI